MTTQCLRVIEYCKTHDYITTKSAMTDLGVGCLTRRITDIVRAGYEVIKIRTTECNRYGETCRYNRYYIKEKKNNGKS